MKVLIIGGMGTIGGAITEAATKDNEVWILCRRPLEGKFKNMRIQGLCGDWTDDFVARKAVQENYDVIIDTRIFNVEQLKRGLEIVEGHCRQFFYISTDAVYLHPNFDVEESELPSPQELKWRYGYNKLMAEQYLNEHSKEYTFYWTIIRPTVTFGEERIPVGFANRKNEGAIINRIIEEKPILLFDDADAIHPICHSSTFGKAVADLFLNEKAKNEAFHVSDDGQYRYDEILNIVSDILNKKCWTIRVSPEEIRYLDEKKYEEMIFDKNPSFTLNSNKIKAVSKENRYHIDLKTALSSAVEYLENRNYKNDDYYDWLSDAILLKYRRFEINSEEKKSIERYIKGLPWKYRIELRVFRCKREIRYMIKKIYHVIMK